LADMKDTRSYQAVAAKKMAWKGDAHTKQRAVGRAGGSYQTSAKQKMQEKAITYEKSERMPVSKSKGPTKPMAPKSAYKSDFKSDAKSASSKSANSPSKSLKKEKS